VALGVPDHVVINGATGILSSLAQLSVPLGGTGAATLTGVLKGNATAAVSAITGTQWGASYWADANTLASTAAGTSGYVLRCNGAAAPTWVSPSNVLSGTAPVSISGGTVSLTTPVAVQYGGTGATTLTGILKGNAASAVTAVTGTQWGASYWSDANTVASTAAGTSSDLLRSNGGAAPTWQTATHLATANAVAVRGASGETAFVTVDTAKLNVTSGGDINMLGSLSPSTFAIPAYLAMAQLVGGAYTTTDAPTDVITITTRNNYVTVVDCTVALGRADGTATGAIKFIHRFLGRVASVTLAPSPALLVTDLDATLVGCTAALYWSGGASTVISVRVTGLALNIRWQALATITCRNIIL
jgi:hypothetical protein